MTRCSRVRREHYAKRVWRDLCSSSGEDMIISQADRTCPTIHDDTSGQHLISVHDKLFAQAVSSSLKLRHGLN